MTAVFAQALAVAAAKRCALARRTMFSHTLIAVHTPILSATSTTLFRLHLRAVGGPCRVDSLAAWRG